MNPHHVNTSHSQQHIDRVDEMIRENNKKYIDHKSQLEYERALQHYEKQRKRQALKQYAQNIKQGNKKAIQKKLRQSSISKNKTFNNNNRNNNRSSNRLNSQLNKDRSLNSRLTQLQQQQQQQQDIQKIKQKQKLSQKQIKKVQKAIQARAQRHLQQLQLQKLNKKLQQERKKTKLYELKQTCQKLLSKSHKRIPTVSEKIPQSRRAMLEQYSKKAQQEVNQLDGIIAGLMQQAKQLNSQNNNERNNKQQLQHKGIKYPYSEKNINTKNNNNKFSNEQPDVFSEQFQIQFMNQVLSKGLNVNDLMSIGDNRTGQINSNKNNRKIYSNDYNNNQDDVLFTKSAKQLFGMKYIPINSDN